jgi:hypothetical protein
MIKYFLLILLITFSFFEVGCQEKSQPVKQVTHPTQTVETIPTKPIVPTKPIQPTQTIVETIPTEQAETLSFVKKEGILKVKEGEKVCLLADDAIDYEIFVSPDATLIAVETLLMSNLQIIRVYKKDLDGCFHPLKNALSTKLWHDLSEQEGFTVDDVSHPRMKFLKWLGNEQVQIELSGEVENKAVDENVSCDLRVLY